MHHATEFVLLSAFRSEFAEDLNIARHAQLLTQLLARDFGAKTVTGAYKGVSELSLCVPITGGEDGDDFAELLSLARRYGQESILHVSSQRHAALIHVAAYWETGGCEGVQGLGLWRQVSQPDAHSRDAYTYDPGEGAYYAAG